MDKQVDAFLQELDALQPGAEDPGKSEAISAYPPAGAAPEAPAAPRERKRRRFESAPPPAAPTPPAASHHVPSGPPKPPPSAVQAAAQAAAAAVLRAQQNGGVIGVMGMMGGCEAEVEINDCTNRVLLTRGETHREIGDKTGAAVLLRGEYVEAGNVLSPEGEGRKLYLKVTAPSQEKVADAVELIKIKMDISAAPAIELPPIIEEKMMISVPFGLQRHQLVGKLLGPKGGNMRFVEQDTGCRIKLIGREIHEQDQPLHFMLMCDSPGGIAAAKELLGNLINTVLADVTKFMPQPMYGIPGYNPYGGFGVPAPMPPGPPPAGGGYDPNAVPQAAYDPNQAAAYGGYAGYDPNAAAYGAQPGYAAQGYGMPQPPGGSTAPPGTDGPPGC